VSLTSVPVLILVVVVVDGLAHVDGISRAFTPAMRTLSFQALFNELGY
jgi:hypothetical protein